MSRSLSAVAAIFSNFLFPPIGEEKVKKLFATSTKAKQAANSSESDVHGRGRLAFNRKQKPYHCACKEGFILDNNETIGGVGSDIKQQWQWR